MIFVMNENFAKAGAFSAFSVSSENSATPGTNLLEGKRRGEVWRSSGFFEVTAANKGIVLQEVASVDQTVNIAEGNYSGDAAFFAAVKAALDSAAGSATYTVDRDPTSKRIRITSNGGGGAILTLRASQAGFTAADLLGFAAVDLTGALTYTADVLRIHSYEFVKLDLGNSFSPSAFVAVGLRNSAIKISPNATIKLQGNDTDVWTAPQYELSLEYSETALATMAKTGLFTARYWRLYIQDRENGAGFVELSKIYLGESINLNQGCVQFPLRWTDIDLSQVMETRSGVRYSDIVQMTREIDLEWFGLTVGESESLGDFVRSFGIRKPFFACLDPNEVFSTELQRHVFFLRLNNNPEMELVTPGVFSSTWSVREEL